MSTTLTEDGINAALKASARKELQDLVVLDCVSSTNTWMLEQERPSAGQYRAVLAQQQTAGRGRHGRNWISPRGAGLYLSLAYTFNRTPDNLACLTLAAGVATVQALESGGATQLGLKWPNDIYAHNAKLGGILVDAQTGAGGHVSIVCGIGINLDLDLADTDREVLDNFEYTVTDLKCHCAALPSRDATAAAIIARVMRATRLFEAQGLDPFRADWSKYDWLIGKPVDIDMPGDEFEGVADGIDQHGALRVTTLHGTRHVYSGTVRVRTPARA